MTVNTCTKKNRKNLNKLPTTTPVKDTRRAGEVT